MASSSRQLQPAVGYYDEQSDPEMDPPPRPRNGQPYPQIKSEVPDADDDLVDEDDEDDLLPGPRRRDSTASETKPQLIPYQPTGVKRKASEASSTHNGGVATSSPATKKLRPEPLEPSILAAEPLDEFVLEIADWVHRMAQGRTNIEVEAKVGQLIDTRNNERISLPVLNETILMPDYPQIRFQSDMTVQQHHAYNQALNKLVERSTTPTYPHARIRYEHTRVIDSFYTTPAATKIRVTTDEQTGRVKECVQKTRIGDLNVYSPKRKLDWRVSVSTETPVKPPPEGSAPTASRRKDRLSYAHQSFKIDLTQVTPSAGQLTHELEIEFADSTELMQTAQVRTKGTSGATWSGKEGDAFDELIRVFVNNIRILVRNAG